MERVAALLAAVVSVFGLAACGDDGAEPGASREATLVLDFQPNAVHAGIYAALAEGFLANKGIDLEVREPSASTDAPKLLQAGKADLAILDIHDFGLARQQGADLVLMGSIVGRPLASVIAGDRNEVRRPRDLEGGTVGVTGLPSDDAVLDSILAADGASPDSVKRITIGFDAVGALSAGKLDAATAFWNAEGVSLRQLGVPTREFRVDDFGAPRYPELVLVTSRDRLREERELLQATVTGIDHGYGFTVRNPDQGLDDLLAATDGLDRDLQSAQLDALLKARAFRPGTTASLVEWERWDVDHGILDGPVSLGPRPPG